MSPEPLLPPDGIHGVPPQNGHLLPNYVFLDASTDGGCHGQACGTNAGQLMDFLPGRWGIPPHRGRTMPHGAVDDTRYYREENFDDDRFYEDAPGA